MEEMKVLAYSLFLFAIIGVRGDFGNDATEIDEMRHKLLQRENVLEKELQNVLGPDDEKYLRLIEGFKTFGNELEEKFPSSSYDYLSIIALSSVWLWARTDNALKGIDRLYNVFRQMQREFTGKHAHLDLQKLADFSEIVLHDPNASIVGMLARVTEFVVHYKLFVSDNEEAFSQICSEQQSLQQLLYNLYITITLTDIKGYSMIQFSYMLLRLYNPGSNITFEMDLIREQYVERITKTVSAVKTAMGFASRDLWRCDATIPKLGYIVNEVDMNKDASCKEDCAHYENSKLHGCYQDQFCAQQPKCKGEILNCEFVDSDMWICPSAWNSDRRYEYIQYENGKVFGDRATCRAETTKVDSWWRWLFWHCSYCFCYCDDHSANSDRYFSLRKVMSDVANNKVITGIALKKVNQIIHMQIQEGELAARGNINKSSISWKPIEAFSVLDSNVKSNVDYHTLAWKRRGLDLDDLVPAQDHLLTGVKFRTVGSRLNLEIMVTTFNFTTGKLIQPLEKSFWLSNDVTERSELQLPNPDIPTRAFLPALPDSKTNQYLNFAPSDRVSDAAQNTIPFLDTQPVETKQPVPIAGAGIFHKGRHGSGGYVALKLITYDFTSHLQVDLPPETPIILAPSQRSEIKAI